MRWPWRRSRRVVFAIGAQWGVGAADCAGIYLEWFYRLTLRPGFDYRRIVSESGLDWILNKHRFEPHFIFFLNWSHIVPAEITERYCCINFHCTPLPYGRGGGPVENMILRGHAKTVITAHRMVRELDAGDIYGYSEFIGLDGTKEQIQRRFIAPVTDLIVKIVRGELKPKPQEGEPTYFKRLNKTDYEAFWVARGGRV